jgi:hypothetical protein
MEFPLRNTHDLRITHQKAIKDVTSHDLLFHIFPNGLKDGARITGYVMRHRDTVDSYPLLTPHTKTYIITKTAGGMPAVRVTVPYSLRIFQ